MQEQQTGSRIKQSRNRLSGETRGSFHIFLYQHTPQGAVDGKDQGAALFFHFFFCLCKGSCTQLLAIEVVVVAMATMPGAIIIAMGTALILD